MESKYTHLMVAISSRKMLVRGVLSISILIAFLYVSFYLFTEIDHMTTLGMSAVTAVLGALSTFLVKIFSYYMKSTSLEKKIESEIAEEEEESSSANNTTKK